MEGAHLADTDLAVRIQFVQYKSGSLDDEWRFLNDQRMPVFSGYEAVEWAAARTVWRKWTIERVF
jgi:hypothetical protein